MSVDVQSFSLNAQPPALAAQNGLKPPFEEMEDEHCKAADQLALFGPAHALDLQRDMFEVRLPEFALAQQRRLLIRP